jgi:hypothetical protein
MAAKFDPKKAYGEVFGMASHRYEQDGKRFDAQGNEVTEKNEKPPVVQSTATGKAAAPAVAGDQVSEQLKG